MIALILGGARSGKSTYAEKLAEELSSGGGVAYIATADALDPEMESRIQIHKTRRPQGWRTWEGDVWTLPDDIKKLSGVMLLDCLTMYISRLFLASPEAEREDEEAWLAAEARITGQVEKIFSSFAEASHSDDRSHLIVVSNEVGYGLVPTYLMGRRFRDMQGRVNQLAARRADGVALIVAGLPLWVKKGGMSH
ncbi:MAG: bifunctional adenosylcobinamide kinase/adenosylcobinamide-phosphate guanylyltransferase [Synergistaceae bacterium]|jgi:adenosylcobinamide kinase/adenosylcobinamide-phosphate guanylyltransferase|nr:bifunctional adenosylcobinamide kinase/adenosylcobinamide-phosphate guanylyltransferase [Synergistaceae bacterium]